MRMLSGSVEYTVTILVKDLKYCWYIPVNFLIPDLYVSNCFYMTLS